MMAIQWAREHGRDVLLEGTDLPATPDEAEEIAQEYIAAGEDVPFSVDTEEV